jgi:hypothetical protein
MPSDNKIRLIGSIRSVVGTGDHEIAEGHGGQIRPQHAEFLELFGGTPLDQQRNEIAHLAGAELRIRVLDHSRDLVLRQSCVFLGETPLDIANQLPLFWTHSDIVAPNVEGVKTPGVNDLLCKSLEKNTFATTDLRVLCAQGRTPDQGLLRIFYAPD